MTWISERTVRLESAILLLDKYIIIEKVGPADELHPLTKSSETVLD